MRYHISSPANPQEYMPVSLAIRGVAITTVDLKTGPVTLVEVWNAEGTTGLAAAPASSLSPSLSTVCEQALGAPLTASLSPSDRWTSDWLEPDRAWADLGLVEAARADLAARTAGVPLWLWFGGGARS
jgi:L-alanine-DL-glutamate epimerase-like enolase superfamily enzyme